MFPLLCCCGEEFERPWCGNMETISVSSTNMIAFSCLAGALQSPTMGLLGCVDVLTFVYLMCESISPCVQLYSLGSRRCASSTGKPRNLYHRVVRDAGTIMASR